MSVMVISKESLKMITIFLVKSLGFESGCIINNLFKVWNVKSEYPKLYALLKSCDDEFDIVTRWLSIWNCKSYVKRYPDEDMSIVEESEWIENFETQWFFDYAGETDIQIHKTLSCYLYQIEFESKIIIELKKLLYEYGNWLLGHSKEWDEAKWG